MAKADQLQKKIEAALTDLLSDKCKLDDEQKKELRSNVLLAIKWQAVKLKMEDSSWGSGFGNGKDDTENESELNDE